MNYFIARKEQTYRNTTLHLQISHVVLYHWGLTQQKKSLAQILVEESKRLDQEYRYFSISQL